MLHFGILRKGVPYGNKYIKIYHLECIKTVTIYCLYTVTVLLLTIFV